jgi:2-succinyl-6-hydroxy-2,4-cyclohexadiene-1-carboxylate synthase
MGGRLALYMALHYPARFSTLILESSSPGLKTQSEREERAKLDTVLATHIEADGIAAFVQYWESLPLFWTQKSLPLAEAQRLHQQRLNNYPRGLANSLRGMGTGTQPSLWDQLPKLNLPVLLLTGALDPKFVAIGKRMADTIPDAQLDIMPDAGHTIHLEQPEEYTEAVMQFLRKYTIS